MSRTLPRSPYLLTQAIYGHPPANKRPPKVDPSDRVARALSYLLQGGAKSEGLTVRSDGYVDVHSLLSNRILRGVDFTTLEAIVHSDRHSRFHILYDVLPGRATSWWIRANQKHSTPVAQGLKPIGSAKDIKMAVHGTSMRSWEAITRQGLSRMSRNHIHLAQGFAGERIRGMKNSSEVLIFIDVARALKEDIKFYLSTDGAVLTPGNDMGYLEPRFFSWVERVKVNAGPIPGWEAMADEHEGEIVESGDFSEAVPTPEKKSIKEIKRVEARALREEHDAFVRKLYAPELDFV